MERPKLNNKCAPEQIRLSSVAYSYALSFYKICGETALKYYDRAIELALQEDTDAHAYFLGKIKLLRKMRRRKDAWYALVDMELCDQKPDAWTRMMIDEELQELRAMSDPE